MPSITRRNALRTGIALAIPPGMVALLTGCNQSSTDTSQQTESNDELNRETLESNPPAAGEPMKVQYLEIVTPEVDALCRQYSAIHGITFSEPDANFGGARTAKLNGGGKIGIRGPLRDTETPVVRPYMLVDDIKAAVESAAEAGAEIAMPPMEIPEHGMFAIVIHGGIECGFWQN
jgi:predicted enzyme related to lactoylglutathione lyase